jgi:cation diffusion facilitator CzcD-associated flavoprotein CzcO
VTGGSEHLPVVVVGAGFAGIAMAVALRQRGITDFTILERNDDVGGTWLENDYPGCACDVASALYSFSFAPNPAWSRFFSPQEEILGYLRDVAQRFGVRRHVRFGVELLEARWDEDAARWRLRTSAGELTAGLLVGAMGMFGDPVVPEVPGAETFAGAAFHSLHWPHDLDLRGKRVAVLGTGPSAIQFVPAIQPDVQRLVVFQRTPPWILPRFDRATFRAERFLARRLPGFQRAQRLLVYLITETLGLVIFVHPRFGAMYHAVARWHLRRQVADPALRARLEPGYVIGCKRAILSDAWYPALSQPNVEVVDGAIAEIRPHAVVDEAGREHPVDVLVYGTGFEIPQRGIDRIVGRGGRTIGEAYDARPSSYNGTALAGFPNHFQFFGAFGVPANQSAVFMIEAQARYIADAIDRVRMQGARTVEVRPAAQDAFVREAEARSAGTVWLEGGCRSYYQTPDGRNNGLWPHWSFAYARRTARFDEDAYELTPAA